MLDVRVTREALVKALTKVNYAVAKKSTLPVLEHVLLSAENGIFSLQTANLVVGVRVEMEADITNVSEEHGVTVPCKQFVRMAKAMPKDSILSIGEDRIGEGKDLKIKVVLNDVNAARGFKMDAIDGGEFPETHWPTEGSEVAFSIPADVLLAGLKKAKPFMETDNYRPIMNGLKIETKEGDVNNLHLVGADGYRLAFVPLTADISNTDLTDLGVVLERSAVEILCKLLVKNKGIVTVHMVENQAKSKDGKPPVYTAMTFSINDVAVAGRLVEGRYPLHQSIMPTKHDFTVTLDANEFLDELKRATTISSKKVRAVRIGLPKYLDVDLDLSDIRMSITAENQDDGTYFDAHIKTEECKILGEKPISAFNVSYAIQLLSSAAFAKGEKVKVSWESHRDPLLFENVSQNDGAKYVIMPMNIGR